MAKKQPTDDAAAPAGKIGASLQEKILVAYSVVAKRFKNVEGLKTATKVAKAELEEARRVLEAALAEAAGDLDAPLLKRLAEAIVAERQSDLMTLSLAAQAPPVPAWFVPRMDTERPRAAWLSQEAWDREEEPANRDAIKAWDRRRDVQRMAQWPWEYARLVLAARPQ